MTCLAAAESMPGHLEVGYLSNQALVMLEQVLEDIYLPLLSNTDFAGFKDQTKESDPGNQTSDIQANTRFEELKSELLVTLQKFTSQVAHTVQQVAGETRLQIPEALSELNVLEPQQVATDRQMISKLENLAEEWIETVAGALAKEQQKVPIGNVG